MDWTTGLTNDLKNAYFQDCWSLGKINRIYKCERVGRYHAEVHDTRMSTLQPSQITLAIDNGEKGFHRCQNSL